MLLQNCSHYIQDHSHHNIFLVLALSIPSFIQKCVQSAKVFLCPVPSFSTCPCFQHPLLPEQGWSYSVLLHPSVLLWIFPSFVLGRNSFIGIATRYEVDGSGIEFQWGRGFPNLSRQLLITTNFNTLVKI